MLQARSGSLTSWSARQAQLILLLEMLSGLTSVPSEALAREGDIQDIDRALRYIESHCCGSICLADIARAAHVSTRTLSRRFDDQLGRGVMDVVREQRLNLARHRLIMRRSSVAEVARSVGVESQAQFSRMFQKQYGLSPKEYQRSSAPPRSLDSTLWSGAGRSNLEKRGRQLLQQYSR